MLGGIVVVFALAFFSLAQSVRVSATGYDINVMLTERDALLQRKQELLSDLNRLGREPAIRKQSIDEGLGQLTEPLVLGVPSTARLIARRQTCSDGPTPAAGMLLLLITFVVIAASLVARLAYWQVTQRERLAQEAFEQTTARTETPSRRGDIYDRSGVVVLATTVDRERLAAMPSFISPQRRQQVAAELVEILRLTGPAAEQLTERMLTDKKYVVLAHGLDRQTADAIPGGGDRGADRGDRARAGARPRVSARRRRPDSTLAAQLLGFVNRDGEGQYGVEQYYQSEAGRPPRVVHAQRDVAGRPIPDTAVIEDAGTAGEDIQLTIDAGLQLALEQELLAAWAADQAKTVSAVVIDPYTGEVLAEATYPSYDANNYQAVASADPNRFIDPVVSSVYEPGSVFKMLTAIAGLETRTVTTKTKIKDVGTLKLDGGRTHVDDADRRGRGWMTFEDAIAYSRNVVAAKVALQLGEDTRESSTILHRPGPRWASGRRPASTSRARSPGWSTTRRSPPGSRSTSPTARSGRASP